MDPPPGVGGHSNTVDPPRGGPGTSADPPGGQTTDPPSGDTTDPPPGDTLDPPPGCVPSELDRINVVVFGDATASGADVEGRMVVGGNAVLDGYAVASRDPTLTCSDYALVVGGDLSWTGGSVGNGRVSYGGTFRASGFFPPCGAFQGSPVDPVNFVVLQEKLTGYSLAFRDYPVNGSATYAFDTLTLTGTDPGLNVFQVTAEELNSNLHLVVPAGSSVLVNVSGKTVNWQGKGFSMPDGAACRGGSSAWCHRVLYNLHEAKTVTLSGIGIQGSLLAPHASLDGSGGNVDGQVVVQSLTGSLEYHPYFFSGCLELPY